MKTLPHLLLEFCVLSPEDAQRTPLMASLCFVVVVTELLVKQSAGRNATAPAPSALRWLPSLLPLSLSPWDCLRRVHPSPGSIGGALSSQESSSSCSSSCSCSFSCSCSCSLLLLPLLLRASLVAGGAGPPSPAGASDHNPLMRCLCCVLRFAVAIVMLPKPICTR